MNYDKRITPCSDCPFLKKRGVRLRADRIRAIAGGVLGNPGATFACHQDESDHCAGALIFAEKNETATQMMRICERIGMYDPKKLVGHERVFDTVNEMLKTAVK